MRKQRGRVEEKEDKDGEEEGEEEEKEEEKGALRNERR